MRLNRSFAITFIVTYSVQFTMANPNNLNVPPNDSTCYVTVPMVVPGVSTSLSLPYHMGMYYYLIPSASTSSIPAISSEHGLNLSTMTVDHWVCIRN